MNDRLVLDWLHFAIAVIFGGAGVVSGLIAGVWRVARIDQAIRIDFGIDVAKAEQRFEEKMSQAVNNFDETLRGLREKINEVELDAIKSFVAKGDFDDFRNEYREDMRDLKKSISEISKVKH